MNIVFDTCGLMVVKLEGVDGIQPFVIEHTTKTCITWTGVVIAAIVCLAIVIIAIVAADAIKEWEKRKIDHEEKCQTHKCSNPSMPAEKTKDDYLKRLLDFLEELSKNEKTSRVKEIDDPACKAYIRLLAKKAELEKEDIDLILQEKSQESPQNNEQTPTKDEIPEE